MGAEPPASPGEDLIAVLEAEKARLEAEIVRLRESERRYRFSAALAGRLVWVADADGAMRFLDNPFVVLTGLSAQDGLGSGWLEVIHPEDRELTRQTWAHCVETGDFYAAEFRVLRVDGEYRRTRSRAMAARGEDGAIRCWYGTTEDIEEEARSEDARRAAEEALRESERLYRNTLEMSRQIAWTAEADGTGLILSDRFRELTGLAGNPGDPTDAIHPDDRAAVLGGWAAAVAAGTRYDALFRMRLKDGSFHYSRIRAAPQRDEAGEILRWYGITEDVHEQEQAQAARHEAEERYRLAAQATNDAIWDCDLVADTIDWGENAALVLGIEGPLGRTPGRWWIDRLHPEDRATRVKSMDEAIESGVNRWSHNYRFRRDDGSYADIFDRGFIIRDSKGQAVRAVGAMQDLTERNRTEAEIRRMQAELIHVSRLSAMGTMASTLAHELNQPLTAISNFLSGARRIAERPDLPRETLIEALDSSEMAARRAGEILRRLRDLVSRGKVSVQAEWLPKLIEEACVLAFVDAASLRVTHTLTLDPKAAWVKVDRIQIQQVLINLIRNAVEAMARSARRNVTITTRAARGLVEVEVADSGPGIVPDHMDSLFSEFMTTKSEGLGLGLPISRTIVEAHGGTIRAENRPDGGAAFIFTLPKARRRRV